MKNNENKQVITKRIINNSNGSVSALYSTVGSGTSRMFTFGDEARWKEKESETEEEVISKFKGDLPDVSAFEIVLAPGSEG